MRRAPIVLAGTVAGLAGVLTFHTQSTNLSALGPTTTSPGQAKPGGSSSGGTPGSAQPGSAGGSGASSGSSGSNSGSSGSNSGSSGSNSGSSGSGTGSSGSGTAGNGAAKGAATGPTVQFGYGQLAVAVTVSGSRITDVTVPAIQTAEPYSQQLAAQVIPMLRAEVLQAQSANINGVTGATYTSQAYAQSLQAALTQLHFK